MILFEYQKTIRPSEEEIKIHIPTETLTFFSFVLGVIIGSFMFF